MVFIKHQLFGPNNHVTNKKFKEGIPKIYLQNEDSINKFYECN